MSVSMRACVCGGRSLVINDAKDTLLFTGPNSADLFRTNLTLWASPGADGQTWTAVHTVDPSNAGYGTDNMSERHATCAASSVIAPCNLCGVKGDYACVVGDGWMVRLFRVV